jgi:mycofactocin system glycosyltransferase
MKPPAARLPLGSVVVLCRTVAVHDNGAALIGGAPTRVLYLTDAAQAMFDGRRLRVRDAGTAALADRLLEAGMANPVWTAGRASSVSAPRVDTASVTYVIPTYGRPLALDRLLASIGADQQVIVVDDHSSDPDTISAVTAAHNANLIRLPVNLGPAEARNAGLRLVTTPYVVFVDTDAVVSPDTVPTLLAHFADPRVALAAPRVLGLPEGAQATWISRYEDARSSLDLGTEPAAVSPRSAVSWVSSTFLLARVDALEDGFGSGMRVAEDVDLVWRLADRGWRIRYEPAATVWHEHRSTPRAWLSRKTFYGTGAHALAMRHPHNISPAVLAPWSAAVAAALLAQRRWSIPVAIVICAVTTLRIAAKLTNSTQPLRVSAALVVSGVGATLSQTMALIVRHWWPLTLVASIFSRRIRRAAILAAALDAVIEYRRTQAQLDPFRFALARRLDDLAYGAGVWFGAIRGRSWASLLPDIHRQRPSPRRPN